MVLMGVFAFEVISYSIPALTMLSREKKPRGGIIK